MKITFLGTCAAEGFPGLFCKCDTCNKARILKGKNIRSRFSIMINENIKIDFPPDSYYHLLNNNLDYTKLKYLFISHPHSDHLAAYEMEFLKCGFTTLKDFHLNIYGWKKSINLIKDYVKEESINQPNLYPVKAFDVIDIEDFKVYVLPANHMKENDHPFIYLFVRKSDNKTFLSAHDTGYFSEDVWNFLKNFSIDIISLDCTYGTRNNKYNHLGGENILEIKNRLLKEKILKENHRFIVNHFSHNCGKTHEELEQYFNPHNIEVAYDGLTINF